MKLFAFLLCFCFVATNMAFGHDDGVKQQVYDRFVQSYRSDEIKDDRCMVRFKRSDRSARALARCEYTLNGMPISVKPILKFNPKSARVREYINASRLVMIQRPFGINYLDFVKQLLEDEAIEEVIPNARVHITSFDTENEQYLWNLRNTGQDGGTKGIDVGARRLAKLYAKDKATLPLSPVEIAVLDTGIDYDHAEFEGHLAVNEHDPIDGIDNDGNGIIDDYYGYNAITGAARPGDPRDDHGHGTHTSSTIAGKNVGVLGTFPAKIRAIKFLGASGGGEIFDAFDAIVYALDNSITLSNNSWGTRIDIPEIRDEISGLGRDIGHVFVAAAGNDGVNNDENPSDYLPSNYPYDNILSVTAIDRTGRRPFFANFGKKSVDMGAPGVAIFAAFPGGNTYGFLDGTSMAAPHATGAVALVQMFDPFIKHREAIKIVKQNGETLDSLLGITKTGKMVKFPEVYRVMKKKRG